MRRPGRRSRFLFSPGSSSPSQPLQTIVGEVRAHHRLGPPGDTGSHHRHEDPPGDVQLTYGGDGEQVRVPGTHPDADQFRCHDPPFAQFATKRATAPGSATGWVCRNEACTPAMTKPSGSAPDHPQAGVPARGVTTVR